MLEMIDENDAQNILRTKEVDSGKVENQETRKIPLIKVTQLPSGFKGYPEGTSISYEPLTLGELEALNSGDQADLERGIAFLLSAIKCNTLPSEELYYWDVMYIGIQRKLMAFGDTRGIIYNQCPKCGNIVEREFDYTELEFKELEAPDLPIRVQLKGEEVEFGLITMKDFLEINTSNGELDVYARMVKNMDYDKAYNLISTCYGKESKLIRFIDKQLNYGLKPLIEECDAEIDNPDFNPDKKITKQNPKTILCGQKVMMEVRSPFEVVFPEDTNNGPDEFQIQYGRV